MICIEKLKTLSRNIPDVLNSLNQEISTCGFPVYSSLDLRDAGWKIGVVDVNLFPAGFNNLSTEALETASARMREFFAAKLLRSGPWKIVVVPEAHTKNQGYLENLAGILKVLKGSGAEARLLWPGDPIPKPWVVKTASGDTLTYLPAADALDGAEALLLNHDLSGGIPKVIQNVKLPTYPSTNLGWFRRRKSMHFEIIDALLKRLHSKFDFIDPWCFSMRSTTLAQVDFNSDAGLQNITQHAEALFDQLRQDYRERDIHESPHIFIKNDAGTYGMGVVSVSDPKEILESAKNLRRKMAKGKESVPISQVILQEGIPTALAYTDAQNHLVAGEMSIYMVNGAPVGGILRSHADLGPRARIENLNSPGARFEALGSLCSIPEPFPQKLRALACEENFNIYRFIARLHAVAASLEECPKT